jgi:erythronate-4-phosphate dehydrogenase
MNTSALHGVMHQVYDIMGDHKKMIQLIKTPLNERANYFDQLRKSYPIRREASAYTVSCVEHQSACAEQLSALGFKTKVN